MNKKEGKGKNTKSKDNNTISNNLLKFPKKTNNKNTKKYEAYNIVSETGDSIYSPQYEELTKLLYDSYKGGQVFISETTIEEVVNRIIDHQKRLGSSLNNIKNDN